MDAIWSMPLSKVLPGDKLQVLVENQGRIGYGGGNVDFKGKINLCNDIKKYPSIYIYPVGRPSNVEFIIVLRPYWQRYIVWSCVTRMGNEWNASQ